MCFEDAYKLMLAGQKVKRPMFKGYWFIDSLDGKIKIVLASGETIEQGDLHTTITNILAEDWEAC